MSKSLDAFAHSRDSIIDTPLNLRGNGMIGQRLTPIVEQTQLDVRAADVDADKQWQLSLGEGNEELGTSHGSAG